MEEIQVDGTKIRTLRNKRRWTQKQLAIKSGVDQSLISSMENKAKRGVRVVTLVKLARAFGVGTDDLLVSAESTPVKPTDPQLDLIRQLVEDMTPEERQSTTMFLRFALAQRKREESAMGQ